MWSLNRRSIVNLGCSFRNPASAGAITCRPMGRDAAIRKLPVGTARAAFATCSISSASRSRRSARSCRSRPSAVSVSERVVRVNSDTPRCCSSRWTLLLIADGEMDSDRSSGSRVAPQRSGFRESDKPGQSLKCHLFLHGTFKANSGAIINIASRHYLLKDN